MFEKLAADTINNLLGEFFFPVDEKLLEVDIWNGEVKLKGLLFKGDAFDFLHLPLTVKKGVAGELRMIADWRNLRGKPVKIFISEIVVLLGPKVNFTLDPEIEAKNAMAAKFALLHEHEEAKLGSKEEKEDTSSLTSIILDNIQLELSHVHLRYEDVQLDGTTVSLGVGFDKITAFATDANRERAFVVNAFEVYRLISVQGFSIYLNSQDDSVDRIVTIASRLEEMTKAGLPFEHILKPITASLFLIQRKDDLSPKFCLKSSFDSVGIVLNEDQWAAIQFLINSFVSATNKMNDAVDAISSLLQFRPATRAESVRYRSLYKRTLNCDWLEELREVELEELDRLEASILLKDLLKLRAYVYLEVQHQLNGQPVKRRQSALFFWRPEPPKDLTDLERKKIIASLDLDSSLATSQVESNLPTHFVRLEVHIVIPLMTFSLETAPSALSLPSSSNPVLVTINFSGISFAMMFRPRSSLYRLSVQEMTISESIDPTSCFRDILSIVIDEDPLSPTSTQNNPEVPAKPLKCILWTGSLNLGCLWKPARYKSLSISM